MKVIILFAGSMEREGYHKKDIRYNILGLIREVSCTLSTNIVVYSRSLLSFFHLENYREKILIAHEHFLDFDDFNVTIPFNNRPPLIGYIGRFSEEKGVLNFTQALPSIFKHKQDFRVIIGGDGQLKESIEASLLESEFATHVDIPGWISHNDLPKYLNKLRLIVIPSYSEGLPNIMLEAMACGTPVLATSVGAIPDIIIDEFNGFIMQDNSSVCIVENVLRALDSRKLEQISKNGRIYVKENFSFNDAVALWNDIFESM